MRSASLMKMALVVGILLCFCVPHGRSQTSAILSAKSSPAASQSRTFFPHNWIRGYTDFAVAPSYNEPDLGRCMFPQPVTAGGITSTCTAYARYLFIGYFYLQPPARPPARLFFIF